MQWFMIFAQDRVDSLPLRITNREAHRARLDALQAENRILTAGPLPIVPSDPDQGFSGSLILAAFETLADAKAWAEEDPFMIAGVYESVDVRPYKPVFRATA